MTGKTGWISPHTTLDDKKVSFWQK